MIPFTDREMERAWRENLSAFNQASPKSNALRLLLFYAVECGLKAVIMKRSSRNRTDLCQEIGESQHDINKLLDALRATVKLKLPSTIQMRDIAGSGRCNEKRELNAGQINQMWRYGGSGGPDTDSDLEEKMLKITEWIRMELQ